MRSQLVGPWTPYFKLILSLKAVRVAHSKQWFEDPAKVKQSRTEQNSGNSGVRGMKWSYVRAGVLKEHLDI